MSLIASRNGVAQIPSSWHASAGGVNYRLKSIYASKNGVNVKVFRSGSPFTGTADVPTVECSDGHWFDYTDPTDLNFTVTWTFGDPVTLPPGTVLRAGMYGGCDSSGRNWQLFTLKVTPRRRGTALGDFFNTSAYAEGLDLSHTLSAAVTFDTLTASFRADRYGPLDTAHVAVNGRRLGESGTLEE